MAKAPPRHRAPGLPGPTALHEGDLAERLHAAYASALIGAPSWGELSIEGEAAWRQVARRALDLLGYDPEAPAAGWGVPGLELLEGPPAPTDRRVDVRLDSLTLRCEDGVAYLEAGVREWQAASGEAVEVDGATLVEALEAEVILEAGGGEVWRGLPGDVDHDAAAAWWRP